MTDERIALLLLCFRGKKAASAARRDLDAKIRSGGDTVLDDSIAEVNRRKAASVYGPRRLVLGTVVPLVVWGVLGFLGNGLLGVLIWAPIGAICGYIFTRYYQHHGGKGLLTRLGKALAAESSVLLSYVTTTDAGRLLQSAAERGPTAASVLAVRPDLSAEAHAGVGASAPAPGSEPTSAAAPLFGMILTRYPGAKMAHQVATKVHPSKARPDSPETVLIVESQSDGRRHAYDPKFGPLGWTVYDIIGWAIFGAAVGVIAGAIGGGVVGFFVGGILGAIVLGICGIFAGAAYGFLVGYSFSRSQLDGLSTLFAPGTSTLVGWTNGRPNAEALAGYDAPGSQRLVILFQPAEGGAILQVG